MIEAFSLKNAHLFGDALASQARLRHRVFVEDRALPHPSYDGMEYDEFDTPAAVYLVWRDPDLIVRGLMRIIPTSVPYMLQKYWPEMCETRALPDTELVYESSRVCVDRSYDPRIRARIMPELLCAIQEFSALNGVKAAVGVTRQHLIAHFLRKGVEWLGEPAEVEGQKEIAFWCPTEFMRPVLHCQKYGIPDSVLSFEPIDKQEIAA